MDVDIQVVSTFMDIIIPESDCKCVLNTSEHKG